MRRVYRLRSYHQWTITRSADTDLESSTINDLKRRFKIKEEEVRRFWTKFLSPSPWNILLCAGIGSLDWFAKAFAKQAFASWHRRQWRGRGLESGALRRLFEVLDYNVTGQVNFEQFLFGIHVLTKAKADMRKRLAFEFCDIDADGSISRSDLKASLRVLHRLYNGRDDKLSEQREVDKFVEAMFEFAMLTNTKGAGVTSNSSLPQISQTELDEKQRDPTSGETRRAFLERDRFRSLKMRLSPEEFGRAVHQHPLVLLFFNLHDDAEMKKLQANLIAEAKDAFEPG